MHFSKSTYIGAIACPKISLITDWGGTLMGANNVLLIFRRTWPGAVPIQLTTGFTKLINFRFKIVTVITGLRCKQTIFLRQSDFFYLLIETDFFVNHIVK